ncbi:MAG: hypothetical protein ACKO2P_11825 [Planctomycetota bacterium]
MPVVLSLNPTMKVFPVAGKSIGVFLIRGRILPGLVLAAHLPFALLPMVRTDVLSAAFWTPPVCLGGLLLFYWIRASSEEIRWGRLESLLLLADAVCLALAFALGDPGWAGPGCVCAAAAFSAMHIDRIGNRHLGGLALFVWAATGLPEEIHAFLQRQGTAAVAQFASGLAWRYEISAYREGPLLHSISNVVDIPEVLFNPAAWTCVFLMTIFWGAVFRRSVLQTLGLLSCTAATFLLAASAQSVWLLQQSSDGRLSTPLTTSVCLLPIYLGMLASTDFFIRFLTAPIPVVGRQGESGSWDNPFIHYWNTFVAGFAMVPLKSVSRARFRLPLTAAALCILLLPIPPFLLVTRLSQPPDQPLQQTLPD